MQGLEKKNLQIDPIRQILLLEKKYIYKEIKLKKRGKLLVHKDTVEVAAEQIPFS